MKKFTKLALSTVALFLLTTAFLFAQVPPDQEVIIVEPGFGTLETAINSDTILGGNRANPTRVYQLKKDEVYFIESRIMFGGDDVSDSTSTLIIVGEEGGNKPIILTTPKDGGDAFAHLVHGSLTIKNVFWPVKTTTNKSSHLFKMFRSNQTLRLEDFVTEAPGAPDVFEMRSVPGKMNIFFKNCYFRDNTPFLNSWNAAVFARGDNGEAIDTLWIENTTVTNGGLAFFGKLNPINFTFFDHNTIINIPKYVLFFDQYKEAYFTNNMFINCNYEGECVATALSQLPDGVLSGVTNLDTIDANLWQLGHGFVPAQEDVKYLSSNNLHFTSPYLDKYYAGEYNDVADYPISNRDWGFLPEGVTIPTQVSNVPPVFINEKTQTLIDDYEGIKADNNYDNTVDPLMVTKGIASQAIGDEFAKRSRANYGVANEGEDFDIMMMVYGDQDMTTVPGPGTEDGTGFADVTDLIEDFSYTADIKSLIDNRPLGSLAWYPSELATYDGEEALAQIRKYYDGTVGVEEVAIDEAAAFSVYPNPANDVLQIASDSELRGISLYDVVGQLVKQFYLNGELSKALDISDLNNGVYILQIETVSGESSAAKFIKK